MCSFYVSIVDLSAFPRNELLSLFMQVINFGVNLMNKLSDQKESAAMMQQCEEMIQNYKNLQKLYETKEFLGTI